MADKSSALEQTGRNTPMPAPTPELVEAFYAAVMDAELPPQLDDPAVIARAIQERIRRGTLAASMEALEGLPSWGDDFGNVPVTVVAFKLNRSAFAIQEGPLKGKHGVYAVVEIVDGNGEEQLVSCGSTNVLTQLVKAFEEQRFPFQAVLDVQPTGTPGRSVQWLRTPAAAE